MTPRWIALSLLLAAAPAPDTVVVKREGSRVMKGPRFFGESCAVKVSPGAAPARAPRRMGTALVSRGRALLAPRVGLGGPEAG
jgi:hypothetical protein